LVKMLFWIHVTVEKSTELSSACMSCIVRVFSPWFWLWYCHKSEPRIFLIYTMQNSVIYHEYSSTMKNTMLLKTTFVFLWRQ
jgi:hypothetical protein